MVTKSMMQPGMKLIHKHNKSEWTVMFRSVMTGIWVVTDGDRARFLMDFEMVSYKIAGTHGSAQPAPLPSILSKIFHMASNR